jgi:hypothetical protein
MKAISPFGGGAGSCPDAARAGSASDNGAPGIAPDKTPVAMAQKASEPALLSRLREAGLCTSDMCLSIRSVSCDLLRRIDLFKFCIN